METEKKKKINVQYVNDKDVATIFKALDPDKLKVSLKQKEKSSLDDEEFKSIEDKPSCLFEKGDVAGQQLFGFCTPKHQKMLTDRAVRSPGTPKTPIQKRLVGQTANKTQPSPKSVKSASKMKNDCTPKKVASSQESEKKDLSICQTPYNLRRKLKTKLATVKCDKNLCSDESEGEDFSVSESDYNESDISCESTSCSENEDDHVQREPHIKKFLLAGKENSIAPSQRKNAKLNFVPATEEYFVSHASKKVLTSNHTLGKLRHQLPQEKLLKILSKITFGHEKHARKLQSNSCYLFKKWQFLLSEGFNVLLYGVGSKRNILTSFHAQLNDPCVVVNGFFPSLSIQEVISSIIEDVIKVNISAVDVLETVDYIRNTFSHRDNKLYLVVHNIDGIMLRNDKSQEILASLSNTPNIHLIASIDHISSALMWDQHTLSMFNFSWWDMTTFDPYIDETAFESSLLVQQSGHLALSSLQNVFCSLTNNAKNIFLLMADYQKEHKNSSNYSGIPFKKLYSLCRESLYVSSDLALRSQLTEFLDHRLVKSRRGQDGSELLVIPINSTILDQFVSEQQNL